MSNAWVHFQLITLHKVGFQPKLPSKDIYELILNIEIIRNNLNFDKKNEQSMTVSMFAVKV